MVFSLCAPAPTTYGDRGGGVAIRSASDGKPKVSRVAAQGGAIGEGLRFGHRWAIGSVLVAAAAGDQDDGQDDEPYPVVIEQLAEAIVVHKNPPSCQIVLKGNAETASVAIRFLYLSPWLASKGFALLLLVYAPSVAVCDFFVEIRILWFFIAFFCMVLDKSPFFAYNGNDNM